MAVLKRDPVGLRPLYYSTRYGVAGESVRELFAKGVPRRVSRKGLYTFLSYGSVQEPYTLVEDVHSVPPGFQIQVGNGRVSEPTPWWTPDFKAGEWTRETAQQAVTAELEKSVAACIEPGRTPAAFLSGGIDSSCVVALLRRRHDGEIRTFCVSHEDKRMDERRWARMVSERNATSHTELVLTNEMFSANLDRALADYDQPSIDGLNNWFACKMVKDAGVDTICCGNGGDELFMGYGRFSKPRAILDCARKVRFLPRCLGTLVEFLAPNERMNKFGQLIGWRHDPYLLARRIHSDRRIRRLLRDGLFDGDVDLGVDAPTADLLNAISWKEMRTNMLSAYLRDGFQIPASRGVRLLSPLLSPALLELMLTIPGACKVDPEVLKPLLVHAAGDGMPPEIPAHGKFGFSLPFRMYFEGPLKSRLDAFFRGGDSLLFNGDPLADIRKAFGCGRVNWSRVWSLYVVDRWCRDNGMEI